MLKGSGEWGVQGFVDFVKNPFLLIFPISLCDKDIQCLVCFEPSSTVRSISAEVAAVKAALEASDSAASKGTDVSKLSPNY